MYITKDLVPANRLRQWLANLPYGDYNSAVRRLVDSCGFQRSQLNHWKYGRCAIPDDAKRAMNDFAKAYNGTTIF